MLTDNKSDVKKPCSCKPVVNGYLCDNVTNTDLQSIQSKNNLSYQLDKTPVANKLHFTDNAGKSVATAIRINNTDIRVYASKDYCDTLKK